MKRVASSSSQVAQIPAGAHNQQTESSKDKAILKISSKICEFITGQDPSADVTERILDYSSILNRALRPLFLTSKKIQQVCPLLLDPICTKLSAIDFSPLQNPQERRPFAFMQTKPFATGVEGGRTNTKSLFGISENLSLGICYFTEFYYKENTPSFIRFLNFLAPLSFEQAVLFVVHWSAHKSYKQDMLLQILPQLNLEAQQAFVFDGFLSANSKGLELLDKLRDTPHAFYLGSTNKTLLQLLCEDTVLDGTGYTDAVDANTIEYIFDWFAETDNPLQNHLVNKQLVPALVHSRYGAAEWFAKSSNETLKAQFYTWTTWAALITSRIYHTDLIKILNDPIWRPLFAYKNEATGMNIMHYAATHNRRSFMRSSERYAQRNDDYTIEALFKERDRQGRRPIDLLPPL